MNRLNLNEKIELINRYLKVNHNPRLEITVVCDSEEGTQEAIDYLKGLITENVTYTSLTSTATMQELRGKTRLAVFVSGTSLPETMWYSLHRSLIPTISSMRDWFGGTYRVVEFIFDADGTTVQPLPTPGCYRERSEPFIKWKHVDGPVLVTSNGNSVWLNLWERFLLLIGATNVQRLDEIHQHTRRF